MLCFIVIIVFFIIVIYLGTWVVLFWNWISVWAMIYGASINLSPTEILWASIYLVMGSVGAWYLWYMKMYEVLRDNGTLGWFSFFFWFFCHGAFCIVMCIGVPETAAAYLFNFHFQSFYLVVS